LVSKRQQILLKTPVLEIHKDRLHWNEFHSEDDEINYMAKEVNNRLDFKSDQLKESAKELFNINTEIENLTIENESLRNKINSFVN
jgi:hypothetical protein